MYSYSCASCGTTDETIAPSTSVSDSPRSPSTPDITTAIWSPVASRTVAKRQCSTRSSPRNMPTWVWVLPTSTAISMARDHARGQMPAQRRVDYDDHQHRVFLRARQPFPENRRLWAAIFRNWLADASRVVDVGAGVGHYSTILADALEHA